MGRGFGALWIIAIALLAYGAFATLASSRAFAQSYNRNFIEPLITEDTFTNDEADVLPKWSRGADSREFFLAVQVEKSLSENASVEITGQWDQLSPPGTSRDRTGFDDLEVMPKYVFYAAAEHELRMAAALDAFFPVGDSQVEASTHYLAGPMLLWAKGMGDLPRDSWLRYLRPIELQGDGGYLFEFSGSSGGQIFADAIVGYNFPFISYESGGFVESGWSRWPLTNLVPFTEINYVELASGRRGRTPPALFITPGLAYEWGACQVSVGTQVALDHAASQDDKASLLGLLNIQLDTLFPQLRW